MKINSSAISGIKNSKKKTAFSEHLGGKFPCDCCEYKFNTKVDLTSHKNSEHRKETIKDSLLKRYNELVLSVRS